MAEARRAVRPCAPCRERRLRAGRGLAHIRAFFSAPVVVFHLNVLSYTAFLCLFAYVLMVDFQPTPSGCEHLLYLWLISLVCEESRQVGPAPAPSLRAHLRGGPAPGLSLQPHHCQRPRPSCSSSTTLMGAGW